MVWAHRAWCRSRVSGSVCEGYFYNPAQGLATATTDRTGMPEIEETALEEHPPYTGNVVFQVVD
jgi:hypothetical protein